jgi:hypothetical protein
VLNPISRDELEPISDEWLVGLDTCIQREEEYVESDESMKQCWILQSLSYLPTLNTHGTPWTKQTFYNRHKIRDEVLNLLGPVVQLVDSNWAGGSSLHPRSSQRKLPNDRVMIPMKTDSHVRPVWE